jgi:type II secretory pathway pseudopilin PulG
MHLPATITHDPAPRRGITLLEVLIACGLLVIGLSTMAALLPASSARLAQASLADRAGVLASNALADSANRGLVAVDTFPTVSSTNPLAGRTLAIGSLLGQLPGFGVLPSGRNANEYFTGPSDEGLRRCGSPRTFLLEDELQYGPPPSVSSAPSNAFSTSSDGSTGPRQVRDGVCWGATLTPQVFPPAVGGAAVLAIAVFKRSGTITSGDMKDAMAIEVTRTNSFYETDVLASGPLLRPCTWVLAIPASPSTAPRWFQVTSSWTFEPPAAQTTRLIFRNQQDFESATGTGSTGSKATILAFEDLLRVDEHLVTLN